MFDDLEFDEDFEFDDEIGEEEAEIESEIEAGEQLQEIIFHYVGFDPTGEDENWD